MFANMKIYSLSEPAIKKLRKRLIQRLLIGFSLASIVAVILSLWNAGHDWIWTLLMNIISIPIAVGFIIVWSLDQAQARWRTIKIEIGDDYVARPLGGITLRVDKSEITAIDEIKGELHIRTDNNFPTLVIPKELDASDYQKIKRTLFSWIPKH